MVHTEAALKGMNKNDLVQLVLKIETERESDIKALTSEVRDLVSTIKRLEADFNIVKHVNNKLVDQLVATERQCWENAQYSRRECLEITGITKSFGDSDLKGKACEIFEKLGVQVNERDIQDCHRLKYGKTIVKFSNRKDCLQILRVKKNLKELDPTELDFEEGTKIFVNESLCPYYRGLWNKCKMLKQEEKIHVFYTYNGIVKLKIFENGPTKSITHNKDLTDMFPDFDFNKETE